MHFSIRLATSEDAQQIAELQIEAWQHAYRGLIGEDYLQRQDAVSRAQHWSASLALSQRGVLVAAAATRLGGFCSLAASRDSDAAVGVGEITAIYVHPDVWRQGHGARLLDAACALARERGFASLTLWVLEANTPARAFYQARGFEPDGRSQAPPIAGVALPQLRYARAL